MRRSMVFSGVVSLALSLCGPAWAQEAPGQSDEGAVKAVSPEEVTTGELRIKMNTDYAKVELDGEPFEDTEFEDNGRTMIVPRLDRKSEHVLKVLPVYPDLEPIVVKVKPSDWKLVRVARHVKMWRAKKKIKFKKRAKKQGEGRKK